ncbi:MAG: hypothetical protein NDJ89_15185 [Oligoflexia bacterium]|nr:hypothetical protein [Oligoflexia bacterium]
MKLVFGKYDAASKRSPVDFDLAVGLYGPRYSPNAWKESVERFYATPVFFGAIDDAGAKFLLIFSIEGEECAEATGSMSCNYCAPVLGYGIFSAGGGGRLELISKELKFAEFGGGGRAPTGIRVEKGKEGAVLVLETDYRAITGDPERSVEIRRFILKKSQTARTARPARRDEPLQLFR